jgi:hypothetical protein
MNSLKFVLDQILMSEIMRLRYQMFFVYIRLLNIHSIIAFLKATSDGAQKLHAKCCMQFFGTVRSGFNEWISVPDGVIYAPSLE